MDCQLRSADRAFFDGDATMVVAHSPRGEFAIMDGHAPLLGVLGPGPVRIHTDTGTQVFACGNGTVRTTGDLVHLLVESAVPVDQIDLSSVETRMAELDDRDDTASEDERKHLALLRDVKERYG